MAKIADYVVIKENGISLSSGESQAVSFTVPAATLLGSHSIIAFQADPSGNADMELEITINDYKLRRPRFRGSAPRGLWEVFGKNVLRAGSGNSIEFRVVSGKGVLSIKEIVLWLQRDI